MSTRNRIRRPKRVFIICHSFGAQDTGTVFNMFPEWTKYMTTAVKMTGQFPRNVSDASRPSNTA
jgi:hypothetical protein